MKIYVAGKWEDRENCKELMIELEKLGHNITMDWTNHDYKGDGYPLSYCISDVEGVKKADLLVCLFEREFAYKGALVEFGIALGLNKQIHLIGEKQDNCIFANHPLCIHYKNKEIFLTVLKDFHKVYSPSMSTSLFTNLLENWHKNYIRFGVGEVLHD